MNFNRLSHDGVTLSVDHNVSTAMLLAFIRRWGRFGLRVAICSTLVRSYWCIISVVRWCSLVGPLRSAFVWFDCRYPSFGNFYPTVPVDVIGMKSFRDSLFDPSCVPFLFVFCFTSLTFDLMVESQSSHKGLAVILNSLHRFLWTIYLCIKPDLVMINIIRQLQGAFDFQLTICFTNALFCSTQCRCQTHEAKTPPA